MYINVLSASVHGISGHAIGVQVTLSKGMPGFNLIGRPDNVVKESRMRIHSALKSIELRVTNKKVVVSLTPSNLAKSGAQFDLAIAAALMMLLETGLKHHPQDAYIGELSLNGVVGPVQGLYNMVECLLQEGVKRFFVPFEQKEIARYFPDAEIFGIRTLRDLLRPVEPLALLTLEPVPDKRVNGEMDFNEIVGHLPHKRAMMAAAAAFHHVLFVGPPGSGKSLLARRLITIMPPLDEVSRREVLKIHGTNETDLRVLEAIVPFRMPGPDLKLKGLTGNAGGKLGEVTLATSGVLYLEEIAEFKREIIETLKRPMDYGWMDVYGTSKRVEYPAHFTLIATTNPCPCGHYATSKPCSCTTQAISRYRLKFSGAFGDRIDIQLYTDFNHDEILSRSDQLGSGEMMEMVKGAIAMQKARYGSPEKRNTNVKMPEIMETLEDPAMLTKYLPVFQAHGFNYRNIDQVFRLARTLADLDQQEKISLRHLSEAVTLRDGI